MASFDHLDLLLLDQYWLLDNPLSYLLDAATATATSPSASQTQSITVSGSGFGSGPEADSIPKRSVPGPVASGRVGKRKPRPSKKKSSTTFIAADAANFRQMVQEVTGVKLPTTAGRLVPPAAVVRPEPQRLGAGGLMQYGYCLPTLDTSAFLLALHDGQQVAAPQYGSRAAAGVIAGEAGGVGGRTGVDFDSFSCFPTLESGKVM